MAGNTRNGLGKKLRTYREKKGYSLHALANLLSTQGIELSVATMSRIENGARGNIKTRAIIRRLLEGGANV